MNVRLALDDRKRMNMGVRMYVSYIYACTYVSMCKCYQCICVYVFVHTHTHTQAHMFVSTYPYLCAHIHSAKSRAHADKHLQQQQDTQTCSIPAANLKRCTQGPRTCVLHCNITATATRCARRTILCT